MKVGHDPVALGSNMLQHAHFRFTKLERIPTDTPLLDIDADGWGEVFDLLSF